MRLVVPWPDFALGDEVALTAVVRELKRQRPAEAIRIENSPRPEIWQRNPHVNWGTTDDDTRTVLDIAPVERGGPLAHVFARQLGVTLADDTPELWLSAEEHQLDVGVASWRHTVAVDPQASDPARRWPAARFAELVAQLREDGWRVFEVARHADPARIPGAVDLTAFAGIRQVASILARCDLYVGNDSGMMHLAAAVDTPQVVVYGQNIPWWRRAYWNTTPVHDETLKTIDEIPAARVAMAVQLAATRFVLDR